MKCLETTGKTSYWAVYKIGVTPNSSFRDLLSRTGRQSSDVLESLQRMQILERWDVSGQAIGQTPPKARVLVRLNQNPAAQDGASRRIREVVDRAMSCVGSDRTPVTMYPASAGMTASGSEPQQDGSGYCPRLFPAKCACMPPKI